MGTWSLLIHGATGLCGHGAKGSEGCGADGVEGDWLGGRGVSWDAVWVPGQGVSGNGAGLTGIQVPCAGSVGGHRMALWLVGHCCDLVLSPVAGFPQLGGTGDSHGAECTVGRSVTMLLAPCVPLVLAIYHRG